MGEVVLSRSTVALRKEAGCGAALPQQKVARNDGKVMISIDKH